jgi:glycosyltransferase involved in cell wall biosynthesis
MRVLLVDTAHEWRGGQSQFLLTARGLKARGHEVVLACQAGGVLHERAAQACVDVAPLRFRGDLSPAALFGLMAVIRERRPDVVQLNDPHATGAGLVAARLARTRARIVATRRVDFHLRSGLSRHKYGAADRVIAVSRAICTILAESGLASERVRLVYEGVPDRRPQSGGHEALRSLGIPDACPIVGNVAALTDHKDQTTLIAAAPAVLAVLPETRFLIVGDGELRAQLEAQARALGVSERCVFAGFRTDLDRLVPCFTLFCLSSHKEGLGTSLLDAMAFARPVVATAAGGIPEAVVDGVTGRIVPTRDPKALGAALLDVLRDPARAHAFGNAGRQRFLEKFTSERMVDETLEVYAEA